MLQGTTSGAIWFFIFLAIHVLWFHLVTVERCAKLILNVFGACFAAHVGTILMLDSGILPPGQILLRLCYGALIMGCSFVLYMPFYYTIATSLSVQTLIVLESAHTKATSVSDLRERFASAEIVGGRLNVMVANGYLTRQDGMYRVAPKGRMVAKVFGYLKEVWKLGPGG
jgi:hypothetical protein